MRSDCRFRAVGLVLLVAGLLAAAVDATGLWGLPLVGAVALIAWLPVRRGLQARRTVAQTVDSSPGRPNWPDTPFRAMRAGSAPRRTPWGASSACVDQLCGRWSRPR
ncbi:hypothetical protein ACFQZC_14510 [Streptacidiphilus monticola]